MSSPLPCSICPPAPVYKHGPQPLFSLLRAIMRNPLLLWSQEHFEAPLVATRTPLGSRVVVSDPPAIRRILSENAANYVRDGLQQQMLLRTTGRSLFSAEGDDWRLQRRALAPFFTPHAVQASLGDIADVARDWIGQIPADGETLIALDHEMAALTVDVLGRTLLAGHLDEPPIVLARSIRRFAEVNGPVSLADLMGLPPWVPRWRHLAGVGAVRDVRRRARRIVTQMLARPHSAETDLITALAAVRDGKTGRRLLRRQLEDNVSMMIGAGSETVAVALTWSLILLSLHPAVRERVESEVDGARLDQPPAIEMIDRLDWIRAVVEEAMRLYPPAPLLGRQAVAADVLCGETFTAGTVFLIAPWVVHRHRRLWDEPDHFRPERFLPGNRDRIDRYAYLPFGAGPRVCIGASFAMREAVLLLALLLRHLRFEPVDAGAIHLHHRVTLQTAAPVAVRVVRREGRA